MLRRFIEVATVASIVFGAVVIVVYDLRRDRAWNLGDRDFEYVFFVLDAETQRPVPGAKVSIESRVSQKGGDEKIETSHHVTDHAGKVGLVRKDVMYEEMLGGPMRDTVTLVFAHWFHLMTIESEEHRKEVVDIHELNYKVKGVPSVGAIQQVEYKILLNKLKK
jgi:hypothetical protein